MKRARPLPLFVSLALSSSLALAGLLAVERSARAQDDAVEDAPATENDSLTDIFWASGQANAIYQYHPAFHARYSGENSLHAESESATSFVGTLSSGARITETTEIVAHFEMAAGGGLSSALGVAGFTNLDVVRNPSLGSNPYLARLYVRQIIPLSTERISVERGPFSALSTLPARRIEVRVGRFGTADFYDVNGVGSDSHMQFMNWTVDNNGAFDFAADTRGYTLGAMMEYQEPVVGLRTGLMLMPTIANGIDLNHDLTRARAVNVEGEVRYSRAPGWAGIARVLLFANTANMGSYSAATAAFTAGATAAPDVVAQRRQGRVKEGVGLNVEQEFDGQFRAFMRAGWNEGDNESFAFTEVNDTLALGGDVRGAAWGRPQDKVGLAVVTNGISAAHRDYLAMGGKGFLLGDGGLNYARENIVEHYYALHVWNGFTFTGDVQAIANPGYNQDRGPVLVLSGRGHVEF